MYQEVLIPKQFWILISAFRSFKYTFCPGVKRHKIVVKGSLVWEKGDDDDYPESMILTKREKIVLFFYEDIVVYSKRIGGYVYSSTRKRRRPRKPE